MGGRHRFARLKNLFKAKTTEDEPSRAPSPVSAPPPSIPRTVPIIETPPVEKQPENDTERNKLQEELWNEAYNTLRDSGNKHIVEYEEILLSELKNDNPDITSLGTSYEERWQNMQQLVEIGLKKTEKEAKIYGKVNDGLQLFDTVRSLVTPAVSAVPQAAIPWVGVCFILEVFSNPAKQPGVHRAGLQHVLSRVNWYWNLAELLLQDNLEAKEDIGKTALSNLRLELRTYVLDLYQKFLAYLIESVCYFQKNRATAFLKSVVYIDYWGGKLADIEASEAEFERMSKKYNTTESRERLGNLVIGVKNIEKTIDRQTQQLQKINEDENNRVCFQDLYTTNPFFDKMQIEHDKGTPLPHCYSWIFLTEGFQIWQQDPNQRLLWIKGDPGKGKTMLLCGIIDRLDELTPNLISCFFCRATENYQNDATAVLRGLIWSLACQHPKLISHVRTQFDNIGRKAFDGPNKWQVLSNILKRMISDEENRVPEGTTIVIDALDECIRDNYKLVDLILEICADENSKVKWLVSSRNWVEIEDTFMDESISSRRVVLSLEDDEEVEQSIKNAVDAFVKYKVGELKKKKKHAQIPPEVNDIFTEKAGNTFLWVALACKRLESKDVEPWQILEILKDLPSGLRDLYRRMMQEVKDSSHASQCRVILAVAALVYRPLSLAELSSSAQSLSQHSTRLDALKRQVLRCKGFLVISDDVVSFVHQSAKDFLLEDQLAKEFVWEAGTEDQLAKNIRHSHHSILLTMLERMKKTLKYDIYDLKKPGAPVPLLEGGDALDPLDPLDPVKYACCYWADHISAFNDESASATLEFLKESLLYWLEACSLLGEVVTAVLAIQKLQKLVIGTEYHELASALQDANRFILYFKSAIEEFPLQTYTSGLLFSPKSSLVRQAFQQHTLETSWLSLPVPEDWDACVQTLEGHTSTILNLAFSGNGKWLASASEDCTVRIWDVATGDCIQTMDYPYAQVQAVAFSPDSSCLVSASEGYEIDFWDTTSGEFKKSQSVETPGVLIIGLLFSPNGEWLASWSPESKVQIRDANTGDCVYNITRHERVPIGPEIRFSFSSDSKRILIGSENPAIRDIVKCSWIGDTEISPDRLSTSGFSSDGTWVGHVYGEQGHSIWNISDNGSERKMDILGEDGYGLPPSGQYPTDRPLPTSQRPSAFSADGKQIATCTEYPSRLAIIDTTTGDVAYSDIRSFQAAASGLPKAMAWSIDSQWLAVGGAEGNGQITIWDPKAIKTAIKSNEIRKRIHTMALSADGQSLALGSEDGIVEIEDLARPGNSVLTLEGHNSAILGIVFSPSGNMLATQCASHVKIWDIKAAGKCVQTFEAGPIDVRFIDTSFWPMAFSSDDSQFAFGKGEEIIEVHDLANHSMFELQMEHLSSLEFSPDGLLLAAGNQVENIQIWDLQTKDVHKQVSGPGSQMSLLTEQGRLIPERWSQESGTQDAGTEDNNTGAVSFATKGYGVGFGDAWLTKDGERLVWLPSEYRSSSNFRGHVLVTDAVVAIRNSSGQLLMFGFGD